MIASIVLLIITFFLFYSYFFPSIPKRKKEYEFGLVLGCPNRKDGSLSSSQKKRCQKAIEAYQKGYYKKLCISGGSTKYGYIEAQKMNAYIQKQASIPYILETKSQTTIENFLYTKELIGDASILVITSQTHIKSRS